LSRLRPARIGRLSYPDDGGIRVHDFARQRVERDGSWMLASLSSPAKAGDPAKAEAIGAHSRETRTMLT
jgi:hypothetical protein